MKKLSLFPILILLITMISCNAAGLGDLVDIEAPEITVKKMVCPKEPTAEDPSTTVEKTSFTNTIYTKQSVTFYGVASDNISVTNVYAEVKWVGDDGYNFLKNASFDGSNWSLKPDFNREGACWLRFVAEDAKNNVSAKSSKIVTLFVDNNAPVIGDAWYIDRLNNGIQYSLQSLDSLKAIVQDDTGLTNPKNKDVAQNGEFNICGSLTDATGIVDSSIKISLYGEAYDGDGNLDPCLIKSGINKISSAVDPSSTNYGPKFKINGTELGLPTSGKHYYQIRYSAEDEVESPSTNIASDVEIEMGWFLWWPESDNPKFQIANFDNFSEGIKLNTGDTLNITVFDDDALKGDVTCKLTSTKNTVTETKSYISDTERESNIILKAPDLPQTMTLSINAKDKNGKVLSKNDITVYVTDDFVPTLILTSPENNQIPTVTGNDANINFTGITLDKAGCTSLEFVWVPDSVTNVEKTKYQKAKEILDGINDHTAYAPTGTAKYKKTTVNNCVVWSAKLTSAGMEGTFQKHAFDFDLSLMNDFASEKTVNKCFVARLCREDGNYTDTEFKLAADDVKPEITTVNPAGNMSIVDKDKNLEIKFRGTKTSGIKMDTSKYKLSYIAPDNQETVLSGSYDSTENVYKYTVTSTTLTGYDTNHINPKFKYEVEDVLGNKNSGEYQFIISALPQIKNITSSAAEKCKKNDDIYINVAFTKPVTCTSDTYLKLKGITNTGKSITSTTVVPAYYSSGSGSTTLVFKYTVQDGDKSDKLLVWNESGVGPIYGMSESVVHLTTMNDSDNLQEKRSQKPIKIDGISPKVLTCNIDTDAEAPSADKLGNIFNGVSYLKAGRTITATIKTDKPVTVQGTPKFYLKSKNDSSKEVILSWQSITAGNQTLTFSKKITSKDVNDYLEFSKNGYLGSTYGVIKDEFGNALEINASAGTFDTKIQIDTDIPSTPVITKQNLSTKFTGGKFKDSTKFGITAADTTNTFIQYSKDGGSNWITYTKNDVVTLNDDAQLVAKVTDYAGNVSKYTSVYNVDIESSFPAFTVECVNSDGNYKADSTLEFKVQFERAVDISATSTAYILLSANSGTISSGAKAKITADSKGKNDVTEATFEYVVQSGDDFRLKVAKSAVTLDGITDKYGISQGVKTLTTDYVRADIYCDTIAPTIVSMTPQGTKTTQNSLNAYDNAKQIKVTFSEPVNIVSGKVYLRQTSGWAIPAMFTSKEFSKVLAAVNGMTVEENGTTLTGSQVLYMDGLEDAENLYGALVGPANDRYHGTAQYVGPYKKMTNGINADGTPDLSVKYVLDFGVDIWDKNNSTKQNFGKTFISNYSKDGTTYTYMTYHKDNQTGWVKVVTPETVITTDTIRKVLEKAHFHERYMNVNSTYVEASADRKTYTFNFPEGVLGETELPLGRQWELVIQKNSFMDDTGNYFGAGSEEDLILVKDGTNSSFMSAGIEKPVIRVERYSYGLGIKQPTAVNGNTVTYDQIDILNTTGASWKAGNGLTTPSAKVAVKIDCASRDATVRYAMNTNTGSNDSKLTTVAGFGDGRLYSYISTTAASIPANATTGNKTGSSATKVVFLAGSEDYTKSCKAYITADATSTGASSSDVAKEGVFQTVVRFNDPQNSGTKKIANAGDGIQAVNIHGTTGNGGVPSIAPFPLRDQPVSSAYMRQTYQIGTNYYWVSYEVLTQGIFSMYAYGGCAAGSVYTNSSGRWYDWSPGYGTMRTGEYTRCDGMHSYTNDFQ